MDVEVKEILKSIDTRLGKIEDFILEQAEKNGRYFVYNAITWLFIAITLTSSIKTWFN